MTPLQSSTSLPRAVCAVVVCAWLAALAAARVGGCHSLTVKVGALLEDLNYEQANIVLRTAKMINENSDATIRRVLRPSAARNACVDAGASNSGACRETAAAAARLQLRLEPMVEFARHARSALEADEKVCKLVASGARAILNPVAGGLSAAHVQSICDNREIPHLSPIAPHPSAARAAHSPLASTAPDMSVSLAAPPHAVAGALVDLISAWNWTSLAIVSSSDESLARLQELVRRQSPAWHLRLFYLTPAAAAAATAASAASTTRHALGKRRAHSPDAGEEAARVSPAAAAELRDELAESNLLPTSVAAATAAAAAAANSARGAKTFRDIFWQLKASGETNVVLDVPTDELTTALKQAQQVGCMTEQFSYLLTSLDAHLVDMEDFKYSRTKITALSMLQLSVEAGDGDSAKAPRFGEAYLRKLGVFVSRASGKRVALSSSSASSYAPLAPPAGVGWPAFRLSPSVVLDKNTDGLIEPPANAYDSHMPRDYLPGSNEAFAASLSSPSSSASGSRSSFDERALEKQRRFEAAALAEDAKWPQVRLSTAEAVLHDSLLLLAAALGDMLGAEELHANATHLPLDLRQSVSCEPSSGAWRVGTSLVNYMRRAQNFSALTGGVSFDARGLRDNLKLAVVSMAPEVGMIRIGEWQSHDANNASNAEVDDDDDDDNNKVDDKDDCKSYATLVGASLRLRRVFVEHLFEKQLDMIDTLIVTTKLSQPYFMLKETPNKLEGNDQYEGFAVDLIHELSKLINFRYRFKEVADKKYGSKEVLPNGSETWNGLIGDIVAGKADIGIVDLTITSEREEAVDFTLPFMNTGISILFKKPTTKVTTLFSFLSPFSSDVWAYVLAAYCGISTVLFFVGHVSPYEWEDPHPCAVHQTADANKVLKNQFSLLNSFWFTIGSLMQQGVDVAPRSMSTRTIAGIWYFFTLIMISSYTANLAAFLTVEKVVYPIESVRDLSNQQEIRYGCVESGSTCTFFKRSQIDTYQRIAQTMSKLNTYVKSNDDGQSKVQAGKFAFFMESTSIEYITERNCNLTQIGGSLDSKGYGIATRKHPPYARPYRTLLSSGILHLQETGMLHTLKNRWWKEKRGGGACLDDGKGGGGGGVTELSLANVGGVFVVLLGGLGISFLVAIAEFMWRASRNGASRDKICDEMMRDLKFALACKRSTKLVSETRRKNRTRDALASIAASSADDATLTDARQLFYESAAKLNPNMSTLLFDDNRNRNHNHNDDDNDDDEYNYQNSVNANNNSAATFECSNSKLVAANNNQAHDKHVEQDSSNARSGQHLRHLFSRQHCLPGKHLSASITAQMFGQSFEDIDDE